METLSSLGWNFRICQERFFSGVNLVNRSRLSRITRENTHVVTHVQNNFNQGSYKTWKALNVLEFENKNSRPWMSLNLQRSTWMSLNSSCFSFWIFSEICLTFKTDILLNWFCMFISDVMFNKRVGVFYVMFNKRVGVFYHNIKHDA
jgi:hypothetical protein